MNSYDKTPWVNNNPPAIDKDNLNNIEQGIYANREKIIELASMLEGSGSDFARLENAVSALTSAVSTIRSDLNTAQSDITRLQGDTSLIGTYYTKTEINNLLSNYYTQGSLYSKSYIDTQLNSKLNTSGGTISGNLTVSGSFTGNGAGWFSSGLTVRNGLNVDNLAVSGTSYLHGEISTDYEYIKLDCDSQSGGPYRLLVAPSPLGDAHIGDVWIKNM